MRSGLFYIIYTLLSILLLTALAGFMSSTWLLPLGILIHISLFLYIRGEFKRITTSTLKYLYLAILAMVIGLLFLNREYRLYNFLLGNLFFLVANLCYTKLFYKYSNIKIKPVIPFILIAFMVVLTILLLLYDYFGYYYGLGLVCLFVVLNCVQAAYLRLGRVPQVSFRLVFYGMLLFFIVQVLSTFEHLKFNLRWLEVLIGALYLISQLMIISGLIREKEEHSESIGSNELI